jgi:malate dehydrogenase (oxaloacetate-decarboxylating)(NADP+)
LFEAVNKMKQRNLYSAMMLLEGEADALISGYSRSYPCNGKTYVRGHR